jgi:hypothetical protein
VIVGKSKSAANGTLVVLGGIGEGDTRSEVELLRRPEVGLAIGRTGGAERDRRDISSALRGGRFAIGKEVSSGIVGAICWPSFSRNAEIDVAQTEGKSKPRRGLPLVLDVVLLLDVAKGVSGHYACSLRHESIALHFEFRTGLGGLDGADVGDDGLVVEVGERR